MSLYQHQCLMHAIIPHEESGQLRARKRHFYIWCFHGDGQASDPDATGWMWHCRARRFADAARAADRWVRRWTLPAKVIQGRVAGDPVVYEASSATIDPLFSRPEEVSP